MAMQWQGLKIYIVLLSFVCGLGLAFGGQMIYKKYIYQQPLNKVLADNKLVEEFTVDNNSNQSVVKVKLSKDANNLMTSYQEINGLTAKVMGKTPYVLEIVNNSDKDLEEVFFESHYVIYQAQSMGNFPEVARQVEESSAKYGVDGKVYIDQDNIYIQLSKADGHYMNRIIPRNSMTLQGGAHVAKGN